MLGTPRVLRVPRGPHSGEEGGEGRDKGAASGELRCIARSRSEASTGVDKAESTLKRGLRLLGAGPSGSSPPVPSGGSTPRYSAVSIHANTLALIVLCFSAPTSGLYQGFKRHIQPLP